MVILKTCEFAVELTKKKNNVSFTYFLYKLPLTSYLLTEYASGILIVSPVRAVWPAIPTPKGTTISSSSERTASSTVESDVTSNNLDTKTLWSFDPRTKNSEHRSALVRILTLTRILWLNRLISNSLEMSRMSSIKSWRSSSLSSSDLRSVAVFGGTSPRRVFNLSSAWRSLTEWARLTRASGLRTFPGKLSFLTWLTCRAVRDPGLWDLLAIHWSTIDEVAFLSK